MMKLQKNIFIWFIVLVYLMGQWGCATGRYEYPKPEPLSEEYRAQLGTIGVVSVPGVPALHFDRPLPMSPGVLERMGQGTVEGAGKSWDWWLDLCAKPFEKSNVEKRFGPVIGGIALYLLPVVAVGVCYVLTPPVAIFGGLGGGIYGAFPSSQDYPAYVEETEVTLRGTLHKYPAQETFQRVFVKEARARTSHSLVVGPEKDSQTFDEMVGPGVDTVLELSVQRIWWKRIEDQEGDLNPPMVFVLVVRARLMRAADKTVWYDQTFVQETENRLYTLWPYPFLIQDEIEKVYQKLAKEMVEKLFLHTTS